MFLKNYAGCSDKRLIEQLNSDHDYQFFCDLFLGVEHCIINYKIISEIRCELGGLLNIEGVQQILASNWTTFSRFHRDSAVKYDYGARIYDPAIGRWHVVDPNTGYWILFSFWKKTKENGWKDKNNGTDP